MDGELLIDLEPDTYLHVIRDGLKLHEINHCIVTHRHCDPCTCYGPDDESQALCRSPGAEYRFMSMGQSGLENYINA